VVAARQLLARIDAADLAAKRSQVEASIREVEAVVAEAETHAARMRALYADEAAPKAQLDAAETGLARARAALATARAAAAEVDAIASYAEIRAPFAGVVTARWMDPGDFAAPGAPIATVQDASRLRVSVTAAPDAVRGIARGDTVRAQVEGRPARAVVEGVVPGAAGNLYTVNALVDNAGGGRLAGSAATLALPQGSRPALLVPAAAVVRQADLTGVRVRGASGVVLRWVRLGNESDGMVEVLSGVRAGDVVMLPAPAARMAEEAPGAEDAAVAAAHTAAEG
jgi:RND family efflux transporter MFP subunit